MLVALYIRIIFFYILDVRERKIEKKDLSLYAFDKVTDRAIDLPFFAMRQTTAAARARARAFHLVNKRMRQKWTKDLHSAARACKIDRQVGL